jgi:23S rRNA (adenine2503-C2)-methyltransferase
MTKQQLADITDFDEESLKFELPNEPKFRISQIFKWLWQKDITSFNDFTNIPKNLRDKLANSFYLPTLDIVEQQTSKDKSVKIAFSLYDKAVVEAVLIPQHNRVTLCVSSQVGCNVGCSFCATGQMGFSRNLSVGEIVFQVKKMQQLSTEIYDTHLSNIVFMGMGEPLLNYQNILRAIEIITDKDGMGISPKRITLSTVGIAPKITDMANHGVKFNLAVSLHSADDLIRNQLIPANKQYNLEKLQNAIAYFHRQTNNRITIEYLLMKGVNDSLDDAKKLLQFCKAFPVKINIIEYNPVDGLPYSKSDHETMENFKTILTNHNLIVNIRRSKGKDIDAACGQLAAKSLKR